MGGIGKSLAKKAQALGMKVVYHNRNRLAEGEESETGVRYVGWEELLRECDVLSLNLPLNKGTRHLIGAKELGRMKKGAVVINTARGAVMDEAALVEYGFFFLLRPPPPSPFFVLRGVWGSGTLIDAYSALESGQIGGCGLDVYEEEPKVHPGLMSNPKVMLLPHMGTWTVEVTFPILAPSKRRPA